MTRAVRSVVVVDRLPIAAKGICSAIEAEADLECVGAGCSWAAGLAPIRAAHADVALIDYELPVIPPLEVVADVAATSPATKVLFLAPRLQGRTLLGLIEAGAAGVVERDSSPARIIDAIHAAAGERMVASPAIEVRPLSNDTERRSAERDPQRSTTEG